MAGGQIGNQFGKTYDYERYTIMNFPSFKAMVDFEQSIMTMFPRPYVEKLRLYFQKEMDQLCQRGSCGVSNYSLSSIGMFGKHPQSFEEIMKRETFVYWEQYIPIKKAITEKCKALINATKQADIMKPRFVFNDRALGDFTFSRAAMAMVPKMYLYSFVHQRKIDENKEPFYYVKAKGKERIYLKSDDSELFRCFKVKTKEGKTEYIKAAGDKSLIEAGKKGRVDVTSTNKKVYLYKETAPRPMKAVKILVGLTRGGYTSWLNDFYTGIAAIATAELLEELGYATHIEVCMGGGRCNACGAALNWNGHMDQGRRFFTFTAKGFDDKMDTDKLLYTVADPSFHNVKFMVMLNSFLHFFDDELKSDKNGNEFSFYRWHGIQEPVAGIMGDMVNPIGRYHKLLDQQNGISNDIIYYYFHKIKDSQECIQAAFDMVLTAENINIEINKKVNDKFKQRIMDNA